GALQYPDHHRDVEPPRPIGARDEARDGKAGQRREPHGKDIVLVRLGADARLEADEHAGEQRDQCSTHTTHPPSLECLPCERRSTSPTQSTYLAHPTRLP